MDIGNFISRYNKSGRKGRATRVMVEAWEEENHDYLDMHDDDEFDDLAGHYEADRDRDSFKDATAIRRAELKEEAADGGVTPTRERIRKSGIPFGSKWLRFETCEVKEVTLDDRYFWQRRELGKVVRGPEIKRTWIFEYSGDSEEYEPTDKTLEDAINLRLPIPFTDDSEPPEDALRFFERWGPLGLFYALLEEIAISPTQGNWVRLRREQGLGTESRAEISERTFQLEDYVRLFYRLDIPVVSLREADNYIYQGYFEDWQLVYKELLHVKLLFNKWREAKVLSHLNWYVREYLNLQLRRSDEGVTWAILFSSLRDALYGVMAQESLSEIEWLKCDNPKCPKLFIPRHGNQKYCDPDTLKCRRAVGDSKR